VWSNAVGSAGPIGVASTNDAVWFTWQDTRNGNTLTQAEDVYAASLVLNPAGDGSSGGMPRWLLLAGGVAVGMGLAMAGAWAVARRSV
jgi:hypothetical protein